MSDARSRKTPIPQAGLGGSPPRPPKKTKRGFDDGPPQEPHIDIPDPVLVENLALALRQKPIHIIADLLQLNQFVTKYDAQLAFDIAAKVARMHGVYARRVA